MRTKYLFPVLIALAAGVAWGDEAAGAKSAATAPASAATPSLRVVVDPRVELLSLIFRLAGNPEYSKARVESYADDVETRFGAFRDHSVVKLARELRHTRGVSYDACMGMAVHLDNACDLRLKVPLKPWPESLDRRWSAASANNFLVAARQFVKETEFREFIEQHHALYQTTETRMKEVMDKEGHLDWFNAYFGERPQAAFTVVPGLLNGGSCYGPHFRDASGREDLFCVLGVWQTDADGLPQFTGDMLATVVHEFCHSYANPLIERHLNELRRPGETLFAAVAEKMRLQAYGGASTLLCESLVRACGVRYALQYNGSDAADRAIQSEKKHGFLWMQELSDLLGEYEAHRDRYPTLESFSPRLVSFFNDYAKDFPQKQTALRANRPKVVSMTPANGAKAVDPALTEIRVTFDRPMEDRSWSMCGDGPHFPKGEGKPHYDATGKTWSVPVNLKPGWDYEFWLNSESYDAFRSAQGVALEPIRVVFKTAGGQGMN
jgi:hypothetical protein